MAVSSLSAREREQIRVGIAQGLTDSAIGKLIGRHRTTVNAEINRNGGRCRYCSVTAEEMARCRRARPRTPKLLADRVLLGHVHERLLAKDSPMTISIELARGVWGITARISHETIYQAIYSGFFDELPTPHLKRKTRKHRGHRAPGSHSLGENFPSIHDRPEVAADRTQVGHLEGDLVVGALNRSAIITIADRTSRHLWIENVGSKRSNDVKKALTKLLRRIPKRLRLTLTWDQGSEIAEWKHIQKATGINIYIADPKSPWQRPTNENTNAHLRRYVGKGTNLNTYTPEQLKAIEQRINTTPRRSLNWATAKEIYNQAVATTD